MVLFLSLHYFNHKSSLRGAYNDSSSSFSVLHQMKAVECLHIQILAIFRNFVGGLDDSTWGNSSLSLRSMSAALHRSETEKEFNYSFTSNPWDALSAILRERLACNGRLLQVQLDICPAPLPPTALQTSRSAGENQKTPQLCLMWCWTK